MYVVAKCMYCLVLPESATTGKVGGLNYDTWNLTKAECIDEPEQNENCHNYRTEPQALSNG
jgi:hypothetical protein